MVFDLSVIFLSFSVKAQKILTENAAKKAKKQPKVEPQDNLISNHRYLTGPLAIKISQSNKP